MHNAYMRCTVLMVLLLYATVSGQPCTPSKLGDFGGTCQTTRASDEGTRVFAGISEDFYIFDMLGPNAPTIVGRCVLGDEDEIVDLDVQGTLAAVARKRGGWAVIDISDETHPIILKSGGVSQYGNTTEVSIARIWNGRAYFIGNPGATPPATSTNSRFVTIVDPAATGDGVVNTVFYGPTYGGRYAYDAAISGDLMFVAESNEFLALRLTSSSVQWLGSALVNSFCRSVSVEPTGSLAYVSAENGVSVVDVSDPAAMLVSASTPPEPLGRSFGESAIVDNRLLVDSAHLTYYQGASVYDTTFVPPLYLGTLPAVSGPMQETGGRLQSALPLQGGFTSQLFNVPGTNPLLVSVTYPASSQSRGIAISGSTAWIAAATGGLLTADISSGSPTFLGSASTAASALSVAVSGNRAYVAVGSAGLQIFDATNPSSPTLLGTLNTPGTCKDVKFDGTYAYLADGSRGLVVVDVSNPAAPLTVGVLDTNDANALEVVGPYAYVADGTLGLRIIDISNAAAPTLAGFDDPTDGGSAAFVTVRNGLAYVVNTVNMLRIVDVSTPSLPVEVSRLRLPITSGSSPQGIALSGNTLSVSSQFVTAFLDVSVPASPWPFSFQYHAQSACRPFAADGVIYNGYVGSMAGYDISRLPRLSPPSAVWRSPVNPTDLRISGDHIFVADAATGIHALRLSAQGSPSGVPVPLGHLELTSGATQLELSDDGSVAYCVNGGGGLQVVDISEPTHMSRTSVVEPAATMRDVARSGNLLFTVEGQNDLRIFDISTPLTPVQVAQQSVPGSLDILAASGNTVYLCAGAELTPVDVSDPASPVLGSPLTLPSAPPRLTIAGNGLYVPQGTAGIRAYDVSNGLSPALLGVYNTAGSANDIAMTGSVAVVADGFNGLVFLDVSNPSAITLLGATSADRSVDAVSASSLGLMTLGGYLAVYPLPSDLTATLEPASGPTGTISCTTSNCEASSGLTLALAHTLTNGATPVSVVWTKNDVPLLDGPSGTGSTFSGAQTLALHVLNLRLEDAGLYRIEVDTGCGNPRSREIVVAVRWAADFNDSGGVSTQDIFDFIAAWFAGSPLADINGSGTITVQDLFAFLSSWFAG